VKFIFLLIKILLNQINGRMNSFISGPMKPIYPPFSTLVVFFLMSLPVASCLMLLSSIVSFKEPSWNGHKAFYIL